MIYSDAIGVYLEVLAGVAKEQSRFADKAEFSRTWDELAEEIRIQYERDPHTHFYVPE